MAFLSSRRQIVRGRRLPWLFHWLWLCALAGGSSTWTASAQTPAPTEYQLKAVFLFNFAQFVEWPTNSFADAKSPIVIGVLGDDPFGNYLDALVRGEQVNHRPLVIKRYARVEDIKSCQILFISASERDRLDSNLEKLRGRSILTVGDTEGFVSRGGMIRFAVEKNKIRLRINLDSARAANLVLSSKLLRTADKVLSRQD